MLPQSVVGGRKIPRGGGNGDGGSRLRRWICIYIGTSIPLYFASSSKAGRQAGGARSISVQTGANICETPLTKLSGIEMDSEGKLNAGSDDGWWCYYIRLNRVKCSIGVRVLDFDRVLCYLAGFLSIYL